MATLKPSIGALNTLTVTGLSTLASATYVLSNLIDVHSSTPWDIILQVEAATTNTPSGNKQLKIFIQETLDGTDFRTGPTSGTTTTREINLLALKALSITTTSTTERATYSLRQALGFVPYGAKVVFQNDLGVALTSATVKWAEVTMTIS